MKKKIKYIIIAVVICLIGCMTFKTNSFAYTEEQKQQAKAWLSAHGYSPDAGGAAAAYQDYLNGKFDEELGITREEEAPSPQSAYEEEDEKEEKSTQEKKDSPANINSVWDYMQEENGNGQSSVDGNSTTEATTEASTASTTEKTTEEPSTQIAYDEEAAEEDLEEADEENEKDYAEALKKEQKKEKNKEAFIVVVLSVLTLIIVFGIIVLIKSK